MKTMSESQTIVRADGDEAWPRTAGPIRWLGSWRTLAVASALFFPFAALFFASSASFSVPHVEEACGAPALDVRFFSDGDDVNQFMTDCGEAGRDAYSNMQIADLFYPAVFGLFFASALVIVVSRAFADRPKLVWLAALPVLGAAFDYVENVLAWRALLAFPDSTSSNALLGFASAAKTSSFWLAGISFLVASGVLVARRLRLRVLGQQPIEGVAGASSLD